MTTKARNDADDQVTAEDILEDLRAVVQDAEALLKATEGQAGEKVAEIRARVKESLGSVRERMQDTGDGIKTRTRAAAQSADEYVHENPWVAVGIAAGIGFLIGSLGRRR